MTNQEALNLFSSAKDANQIKDTYRKLAKIYHPDLGGSTSAMQAINAAYHYLLKHQHQHNFTDSTGETRTYYYNESRESELAKTLSAFFSSNLPGEALIVGSWIWIVDSNARHKDAMKRLGFSWNDARTCYQWHLPKIYNGRKVRTKLSNRTTDELLGYYGAQKVRRGPSPYLQ